ncbi:MAG: rRNA maturation RNase YbeY [Nitriliruptorales bacterium]|nr:rRNA maturation RNase YbeY [Nitriliruptorales bacterium]
MAVFVADEQSRPVDSERLLRLASFVLRDQGVPEAMEVSLLFVERDVIAELNAHHMGAEGPTDVLAFPIDMPGETRADQPAILGDVVICPEVAADQAGRHDNEPIAELELLVAHGLLHLLGHDHAEPDDRARMFSLTDRLLGTFRSGEAVSP